MAEAPVGSARLWPAGEMGPQTSNRRQSWREDQEEMASLRRRLSPCHQLGLEGWKRGDSSEICPIGAGGGPGPDIKIIACELVTLTPSGDHVFAVKDAGACQVLSQQEG